MALPPDTGRPDYCGARVQAAQWAKYGLLCELLFTLVVTCLRAGFGSPWSLFAYFLNERGIARRGQRWTRARVHEVLANPAYIGDYYFNRSDGKPQKPKPPSEWVKLAVAVLGFFRPSLG